MVLAAGACTHATAVVGPTPDLAACSTLNGTMVAVRDSATAGLMTYVPPRPIKIPVPNPVGSPLPAGTRVVIRVMVDTLGHAVHDSTLICGVADAAYRKRLAAEFDKTIFVPAHLLDGTLVVRTATISMTLGR